MLPANVTNQRLALTYLVADAVVTGTAGTTAAAAGTTGAAGTGGTTGAAGTTSAAGTGGTGSTPVPAPTPAPGPIYQVISTGSTTVDPNLVNAWGLAFNPAGPIWVANAGSGLATVYDTSGQILPVVVTIPPAAGMAPPAEPTGLVFNDSTGFAGDTFIFASEGGTIAAWQTGVEAVTRADNSGTGAIYKGLAMATLNGATRLYATDFHNAKIDVWDESYAVVSTAGFVDPNIPAGYAPFGIRGFASNVYVSYALQDANAEDDVKGAGNGFVDVFDFNGVFIRRLISQGALNAPWGMALAPDDFGGLSDTLLIGNFGDGRINAFDLSTGALLGTALDTSGNPLVIDGLWAIEFGNDTTGAAHNQLFFTAGPDDESHGALGRLDLAP